MRKTFKYRLLGSKEAFIKADKWLYLCQQLYNSALAQKIILHKYNKTQISCYDQQKQLTELKREFIEYSEIYNHTLQDVFIRLDKSYKSIFKRIKNGERHVGFPRFKNMSRYSSFTILKPNLKLEGKYLSIRNVGKLKIRLSRPIEGDIKTATIRKEQTGKWYVSFSCDNTPEHKLKPSDKSVGIDVGLKSFCVDSNNNQFNNTKYLHRSEKLLRTQQRKLRRRIEGSNRRDRTRLQIAKTHDNITNQRNDFLHKTTNYYIHNYGKIYIENLNIQGMVRNHHLAKSISDSSWGKFFEFLKYKAAEAGTREIIKIDRFEPSSKTCSNCGLINDNLKLSDRTWVCLGCGTVHDRDFNAAKNIKRVGQTQQILTCGNSQSVVCESQQVESVKLNKTTLKNIKGGLLCK